VRSATPGQALDLSNTQPFVAAELSFIHNGYITGFRQPGGDGLHRRLRRELDDDAYAMIHGNTDSEHLFAWLVQHVRAAGELRRGVEAGLAALEALAGDTVMSLNFALSDGATIVAGRHALGTVPPSLYVLAGHRRFPGASLVTSEPLFDDPAWTACPPNSLTILSHAAADRPAVHALAA
jgi:glutamine amidotransferase